MKRYIETRCFEELGCKPSHAEKKGLNAVDGSQNDGWDEWGSLRHDSQDLSYAGKSKGKGGKGQGHEVRGKGGPCYRCQGQGHLARVCPTPEGSTEQHICLRCGGAGHFARDHQQQSESWQPSGNCKGKEGDGWEGEGERQMGGRRKKQGQGQVWQRLWQVQQGQRGETDELGRPGPVRNNGRGRLRLGARRRRRGLELGPWPAGQLHG